MRNESYIIAALISVVIAISSCSDFVFGDRLLGDRPESSSANLDTMFNSMINAEKVLTKAYTYLPYGLPTGGAGYNKLGVNILEALTDLHYSFRNNISDGPVNLYYNGALGSNIAETSQNTESYRFGSEIEYNAIHYAWIFVENANKIPGITTAERNQRIAEAKMIIAIAYSEMLRYCGGVPIIDHAVDVNEDMYYPRATFSETVDFIVKMINEAEPYLPWRVSSTNDGRMSRGGALALKTRVLLWAASPTFNSNESWHPQANEYTCYCNYNRERWKDVIDACNDFFTNNTAQSGKYTLIAPAEETPAARREAFRKAYYDRGGTEILISTRRSYDSDILKSFFNERKASGPTLNYVNMFPWDDGTDFPENFDWEHPSRQPFYDSEGLPTRDPRLYETVAVPGTNYFDGTKAPVYINHPDFRYGSGFMEMKFILENNSDRNGRPIQWPYLRLPEVYLTYAEALNEYNGTPSELAYECVNTVRRRVGLKDLQKGLTQEEFREAVIKERALEFGFEEVRWFDLVRLGREADFRKKLYGLQSIGNRQNDPSSFEFSVYPLSDRAWVDKWDTKWYLSPIPQKEVNAGYGMTQNPGW